MFKFLNGKTIGELEKHKENTQEIMRVIAECESNSKAIDYCQSVIDEINRRLSNRRND